MREKLPVILSYTDTTGCNDYVCRFSNLGTAIMQMNNELREMRDEFKDRFNGRKIDFTQTNHKTELWEIDGDFSAKWEIVCVNASKMPDERNLL